MIKNRILTLCLQLCAKLRNSEVLEKLERLETALPNLSLISHDDSPVDKRNVGQH